MMTFRLLSTILITCILFCGAAQAINLQVTVIDGATDDTLADASVYVDGEYIGNTASDGTYTYVHAATESMYLKVVKSGYEEWVGLVKPDEGSVLVEISRKTEALTVELYDAETLLPVSGALVSVDGEGFSGSESTDASGSADFSVKAGKLYTVEVRTPHYYDLSRTVQMADTGRVVQYWLFRNDLYAVFVRDAGTAVPIAGAEVTIDGAYEGVTGDDGMLPLHLQRERKFTVQVEAPDYQPYRAERFLAADDLLLTVLLSQSVYPLSITVFDEEMRPVEDAEVYLDGTSKGKTNRYGRFMLPEIVAGTYEISVRATGFEAWTDTRQVTGAGEDLAAELQYDRANVTIHAEEIDHQAVSGATVLIDGEPVGVTDSGGMITAALKTHTRYSVAAVRDGYQNATIDVEIPFGTTELAVPLTLERSLNVGLIIGGVAVCVILLLVALWRGGRGRKRRGGLPVKDHL
jgi:hypothetical protein